MKINAFQLSLIAILLGFLSSAPLASAQQTTTAAPTTIKVTDQNGAVIPNAQVEILPAPSPDKLHTGADGKLTVTLNPGAYSLSVSQPGFRKWHKSLLVQASTSQTVSVVLQIGSCPPDCMVVLGPSASTGVLPQTIDSPSIAGEISPAPPSDFDGNSWWNHVKFLADDKLEGRDTGSRGEREAQKYAVAQLKKAGAEPAGVKGYYQPVKFISRQIVEKDCSLTLVHDGKREPLVLGEDAIIGTRVMPAPEVSAPLVFAGYGLKVPENNYDDFAGLDLKGKIVVIFSGSPAQLPGALASHYSTAAERWKTLRAAGAIGMVSLINPASMDIPWSRIALNRAHPSMDLDYPEFNDTEGEKLTATINPASAEKLFAGSGHTFAEIAALGKDRKPLPHFPLAVSLEAKTQVEVTKIKSANLVAKIPGSDPALKDQYVVLSAHLDHIGIGEPINGDRIYNGAMDNGSGSALVLDMAASFKQHPEKLRRSILLVLVTGEEKGLLGSKYFAAHPTVPADSMVADVNVDMFLPIVPLKILTVEGLQESDLGDRVSRIAMSLNVKAQPDPEPQRNIFIRSDQYNFIRHGVPSIMMQLGAEPNSPEQKLFKDWLTQRYHAPSDDVNQPVDLAAAAKYEEIVRRLLINVADDPQPPRWKPDSFFRRYAKESAPAPMVH